MLPSTAAHILASDSPTKEQRFRASRWMNFYRTAKPFALGFLLGVISCVVVFARADRLFAQVTVQILPEVK